MSVFHNCGGIVNPQTFFQEANNAGLVFGDQNPVHETERLEKVADFYAQVLVSQFSMNRLRSIHDKNFMRFLSCSDTVQLLAHPSHQFFKAKGLGHVVVGSPL